MDISSLPRPVRWLFYEPPGATNRDWLDDAVLTLAASLLTVAPYAVAVLAFGLDAHTQVGLRYGHPVLVLLAAAMFTVPLVFRRHYPLLMTVLVAAAGAMMVAFSAVPMLPIMLVPMVSYSVARWVPGKPARLVAWLGLIGAFLGPTRWLFTYNTFDPELLVPYLAFVLVCVFAVVTPYAIGRRVAETAEFVAAEARRQRALRSARQQQNEQRAHMAEIRERQRIAQELHDIVAHSLSVMIVQAEGGRALASKRPEAAGEVLDTIAETGREALGEMRRIVAVLRTEDGAADFGPAPTLSDLPEMVRRAGDRISLHISGQPYPVSPALGLTLFRVAQEAVTNVLKHAGPTAHGWVSVIYEPWAISLVVRDNGIGSAARSDGLGNGLRGMRDRLASVGGVLHAGPVGEDGFQVHARVPITRG